MHKTFSVTINTTPVQLKQYYEKLYCSHYLWHLIKSHNLKLHVFLHPQRVSALSLSIYLLKQNVLLYRYGKYFVLSGLSVERFVTADFLLLLGRETQV